MLDVKVDAEFFADLAVNCRLERIVVRFDRATEDRPHTGVENPRRVVALLQQDFAARVDRKHRNHVFLPNHLPSSALITVSRSLSPRPDRLISRTESLGMVGARLMASATACELSSAGIMPSSLLRVCSASSASSSVA